MAFLSKLKQGEFASHIVSHGPAICSCDTNQVWGMHACLSCLINNVIPMWTAFWLREPKQFRL